MQAQAKTVTTDWGLVASGLGAGDWFRLVVVTSGTRNETVTNIAAYNTFVQNDVSTTGHTDTTSHSSSFKVLGCTSSTSAITNTGSSDTSAPIYWLGGVKVTDAYADHYDNSWHSNVPTSGITSRTFTGCLGDGRNSQKFHLGEVNQVTQGYPANQSFEVSGAGSPSGNPQNSYGLSGTRPMYGVSEVFQVGDTSSDATLSGLTLENASDDSAVTLNEMFASTTTFYTADVANDVDKVTIKPTLSDSNAAYVFLDDSDAELTDSDTTKDNFQVVLAEGLNTIKVKVTAENDMSIEIYTVVVTREPSTRVLVSNTGQDADGQQDTGSIGGFLTRNAQRFTTGSNTGGYTLEEVKISLTDVGANSLPVITINAANGVNPGTVLYNLTNPTNLLSGTNTFTPPVDATLSDDTNYFVVMENSNTDNNNAGRYGIVLTSDNSEDNVGLSDWSIADIGRTGGNSWGNVSSGRAFKIRLSGTVDPSEPIPASTDATLSGLSVNDGTSDLTLTPGFVSDTYVYAADVGNAVEEVTLSATVNDDGAEVSGVTLDGTAVADTDFTDGITVPSLVVGDNVIVVTVAAEEASIILTYSITVTRVAIAPGAPTDLIATAAGETRINLSWTAPTSDGGATISGYKVEVSLTGNSGWSDLVANTGTTDTTYSHTGLSAGNTRHYRVKAINSAGTGSASDVAGATTAAANVLVSNTGQTVDPRLLSAIGSRNKTYSQGFETGTNPGGYSLASVGVYVYVETLGTGETFTVHIYTANSAGAPDILAYTLTSPASYADRAVNTFTAPAGATLDADTDYLVVFEGTADESLDFVLGLTSSDEQDRGSRSGWEIEDTNRYQGLMQTAGHSYQISVNGSAVPTDVPATWALKPTGLTAGDTFRLLFLSSTKRDASSTDIADYNTFIQTTAAAGHTAIQEYSSSFTAVGCTSSTDAHDNTDTTGTGVPIYWLGGDKVADNYEDFYDGTWDNESDSHDRNEDSSNGTITSISANYPWTGCGHDGTEGFNAGVIPRSLGNDEVRLGAPGNSSSAGPINGNTAGTASSTRPMYGLSPVFKVVAASSDATLSGLVLTDASSNAITLIPTFVATTKSYTASVTNDDDEITIVPTVNDSSANYEIQDGDGNALTDSDSNVGDLQVDLDVGDNTIKVEVTAEDTTTTETYQVVITRTMAATATEVPASWSLKPTGLGAGDEFRLIFLSSTKRDASSTDIADYNTFLQNLAAAGHAAIQTYNSGFTVVGCTQDTDARDNTNTTGTGVPIYWLNGAKIAADYADFYDGEWDDEANPKSESGTDGPDTSDSVNYPFTGCEDDGTEASNRALGNSGNVLVGRPNSSTSGHGPIGSDSGASSTLTRPMYGVSEVFQVGDASSDATLSGLTLENASDDSGVTLNEMFASTTTFYTADVANDVDKVTIKPTLSDSNAAYVLLDDSDAELTDSDTTKDNFQVALAEGLNTIKVKVTAENDMSIEIYTVVVTREPSTRVLVSNTGQDADGQQNTGSIGGFLTRNAQRFTTGSNTGGYTLEEVKISLIDVGANSVPVITINAANGVNPGTALYNLTNPTNLLSGTNIFTPPADATLSADTNYFVVMENSNTDNNNAGRYGGVLTSDNSEDNVGLSDWSIADIGRTGGNSWGNVSFSRAFKIRLSGTVEPSEPIPASTDATLSDLSVNDGTSDLTLTPGFVSDTYVYAADVGNAVEEVTLSATVNDDGAEVSGVTLDGTAVADTDFTDGITVPSLVVGDNVIVVTVAAEETSIILTYSITVTQGPVPTEVPSTWNLRPSGLSTGDEFRLLFLSSQRINGSLVNISAYNTLIQGYVGLGHAAIQEFSSGFTAVGCTEDTDARDNTATTGTGIPIYWLGGGKVATDYWHFYDGDWDDEANPKNELGANGLNTSLSANYPWTGCGHDGREDFDGTTSLALGKDFVRVGRPDSSTSGHGPLSSDASVQKDNTRPMYGLSPVFKMAAATDATLSGLSVNDGTSDLTLTPGFVSDTYVYAADVGNAVEEVTLSATVNDDGAEVSGVTLDGTAVADTDFTDGITVPSLVVGDNVIAVTVAAEETSIILTYSITVTRATIAPSAPTDLTATAAGETRINLSWRAPTSDGGVTISGYKVEVFLTGTSGWSDLVANTGATDTTYSHTGLSAGNTRHYRVKAINSAGTGSASDVAGATTAAANVLVSNTGQTVDPRLLSAIGSRNKTYSQGFETGTNPGGYSLASVGVYVYVETLGTGETFTVHIYTANSAGAPDTLAYTLTSPASYADGAVNTFTAPAGATLDADTDYFVVFEGTADASLDFILGLTSSDEQDRGSRSGWEIEDTNRYQGLMQTAGTSYQISVNGSAVPTDVPSTWALKPTGLTTGDTFRLLFLSSISRNGSATGITDYNTFVQDRADAGHTAIQGYSDGFRVVGCTNNAGARDNTRTIYTASDKGVSIYWLNGARAADDYEDFYDGDWDEETNDKNESGTDGPDTSLSANYPFTGCDHNGTEEFDSVGTSEALGRSLVTIGRPNDSTAGHGPLDSSLVATNTDNRPFYGLSEIFQVVAASTDATLSALTVNDGTNDQALTPTFAPGTYVYATTVGNTVTTVTLTATVNHSSATISAVTLAGAAITDSDFSDGIAVPSLVVGDNVIVVTVTAEDTTTQAYTLTVTRSTPGNTPATGKPGITGTARVGEDLTATTGGISDAEGKTNAENGVTGYAYTYKWFRVNGGTDTEITGQTALTYTLVAADVGKKIKVMVAFSDDAGNVESPVASDAYPSSGTVLAATIAVSISADKTSAVFKEDGITYTLTRTGSTTAALPVSVTLTQTKSFLATTELSKTVTIPAGHSTETFTVAGSSFQHFPVGDVVEGGTLTAAVQDGTDYDLGTPSSVAVNIVIGAMIRIEMASYTVNEADGSLLVKLIARTGPGAPQPTANSSSVDLLFEDVTAIENTDYFSISGNNFVFSPSNFSMNAGVWEAEKTYPIVITNDDIDEDDETFLLKLEYLHNMGDTPLVDSTGNACDSVDGCEVTVTIVDNDTAGVTVSKPALTVMEQDTTGDTYTVVLDSQPTAGVTVTVSGHTGTDVTPNPTSLPFTTGNWSTPQIVTVTAGNDTDTVSDSVTLTHSAASSDTDYSGISIANVGVTVNDNDSANSAPTFPTTTADRTIAENTAAGENVGGTFTATDSDGDTLTYTLEGTDAASFNLITASGSARIHTKAGVTYNHEVKSTYTVVVKADDSNGGTAIVTVTITITDVNEAPGRPAAPSVSGTAGSTSSLTVSWAAPDNTGPDINNYDLQYRQGTSGSFTNGPQNVTGITTTIPNLSANTSYQVQVRATNAEGDSPWSPSGTGSTGSPPVTPSGQVTGVNITPGDRILQVNWAQVSGATGYKVQWKSGGQSYNSSRQATISSGSTTSRTISNLNNGTEYTVRVIATKTGASDGTPSDDANATPTAAITAPGAPRGLNATAIGNTRINLSWNGPDSDGGSPITGYKIEVSSNGNSWTTRVANTGSANRTYSHTGLSTGDTRHYRVSAINSSGTGPHSNVARASTGLPVVSIASASTTEGQDIVFTVTISPPISGFRRLSYGTGSDSIPSGSKAATAGNDYVTPHPASKVIQIGYGLTSVEIRFRTIDDDLVEGTEVFGIGLHGSSDEGREYSVGTRTAIGTIRDNDNNGQGYVDTVRGNSSTSASISSGGSVTGRIEEVSDADWYRTSLTKDHCYRIGVAGSSDSDSLTLPYPALYGVYRTDSTRISGTSARADYGGNKAISHVKLDTSGTYYISVGIHRFLGEGTYRLSLSDLGTSSTACGAAKAGAIAGPLEISVADASKREWPNPQAYLAFDVTLDRDADEEVRVDYATVNGTAVAGQDYESQSGTLVFGTGEDSKRIWVPIQFDREDEETETMTLRLSNASGAQIRRGAAIGSIYDYSTSR